VRVLWGGGGDGLCNGVSTFLCRISDRGWLVWEGVVAGLEEGSEVVRSVTEGLWGER
jgi:hypothetical protein